jgi:hypothetical protein
VVSDKYRWWLDPGGAPKWMKGNPAWSTRWQQRISPKFAVAVTIFCFLLGLGWIGAGIVRLVHNQHAPLAPWIDAPIWMVLGIVWLRLAARLKKAREGSS